MMSITETKIGNMKLLVTKVIKLLNKNILFLWSEHFIFFCQKKKEHFFSFFHFIAKLLFLFAKLRNVQELRLLR
jgi:hypothetical protein